MAGAEAIGHKTVFADAAVEALLHTAYAPQPVYVDATFGGGGHSRRILRRLPAGGRLLAMDCDEVAAARAERLRGEVNVGDMCDVNSANNAAGNNANTERFMFARGNYSELPQALAERSLSSVCGVLFDLGVSSMQLDDAARGFSFNADAPLDMRMDTRGGATAAQWLAQSSEQEIYEALKFYGEEPEARRVARRLFADRARITTTAALAAAVRDSKRRRSPPGHHPATRAFQALRIAVNDELANAQKGLQAARDALRVGGHLVVIAFHSLEDRIAKRLSAALTLPGMGRVGACDLRALGRMRRPPEEEVAANPRARSACMRVFEKIDINAESIDGAGRATR